MAINYEMLFFYLIFKPKWSPHSRGLGIYFGVCFPHVHLVVNTPISWVFVTHNSHVPPFKNHKPRKKKYVLPLMSFLETSHEHSKPQNIPCHPQVSPRGCEECQHEGSEAWIVEQIQTLPVIFFPTMDGILSEMDWRFHSNKLMGCQEEKSIAKWKALDVAKIYSKSNKLMGSNSYKHLQTGGTHQRQKTFQL